MERPRPAASRRGADRVKGGQRVGHAPRRADRRGHRRSAVAASAAVQLFIGAGAGGERSVVCGESVTQPPA
ncbi:MAG: hypothetical protein ACK55I_44895, partial [bacterium]